MGKSSAQKRAESKLRMQILRAERSSDKKDEDNQKKREAMRKQRNHELL